MDLEILPHELENIVMKYVYELDKEEHKEKFKKTLIYISNIFHDRHNIDFDGHEGVRVYFMWMSFMDMDSLATTGCLKLNRTFDKYLFTTYYDKYGNLQYIRTER